MTKRILAILLAACTTTVYGQQHLHKRYLELGIAEMEAGNCKGAVFQFDNVMLFHALEETALMLKGQCLLRDAKYAEARKALQTAYDVNTGYYSTLIMLAVLDIEQFANINNAQKKIDEAGALLLNETEYADAVAILTKYKNLSPYPEDYDPLFVRLQTLFDKTGKGDINRQKETALTQGIVALEKQQVALADEQFNKIVQLFESQGPEVRHNMVQTLSGLGEICRQYGQPGEALRFAELALNKYSTYGIQNYFLLGNLISRLGSLYVQTGAYEKALALFDKWEPTLAQGNYPNGRADLIVNRISAYMNMFYADETEAGNKPLLQEADKLDKFTSQTEPGKRPFYYAIAEHTRAIYYYKVWPVTGYPKTHITKAKEWADKAGDEQLSREIESTMGLINNTGVAGKTDNSYEKRVEDYLAQHQYTAAIIEYNNAAAMRIKKQEYQQAIADLEKATALVEKYRLTIPAESRIGFMDAQASVYNGLIYCHAMQGNSLSLYTTLEASRGRVLSEQISPQSDIRMSSHTAVQQALKPDEVAVMYGIIDLGAVCMVIITKDTLLCKMVDKRAQFETLYQTLPKPAGQYKTYDPYASGTQPPFTYLLEVIRYCMQDGGKDAQLTSALNKSLSACYNLLIEPVQPYLAGKNTLIICPDAQLSFLPFDALMAPSKKYLAEQVNVRYVPSMSVYQKLTERKYTGHTHNILAFGGAEYTPYSLPVGPPQNLSEFVALQEQVKKNFAGKTSQRTTYGKLGIMGKSWSYLPGTLLEIQNIQTTVPKVVTFSGSDFSESKIKELSGNGSLMQYQVLHFATHGMTMPSIPELSCIITTLSDPESGREDGYLTAYEIAQLRMQANFVALSACETGLGKVYAGEGVSGFVSALITAGANGISVSHWAISDHATMLFMSGLYDLKFNQSKTFSGAMSEMKRSFIRGDHGQQYRHPNYWAPFAYYGL